MLDRQLADFLYTTDTILTWEQIIQKQIDKRLSGDDIYKVIIESSQRSKTSVNQLLGLEQDMYMSIHVVKHINKEQNNRVEYLFVNFDYFDGNDLVAKLFGQEYGMLSDEKIDGIYYSIIKLHKDSTEYDLIWHEDVGNYIFSLKQDETSIIELEQRLEVIVDKLNKMIKAQLKCNNFDLVSPDGL